MVPSISVGETERGGAWGLRVGGLPIPKDDKDFKTPCKGGFSEEDDSEDDGNGFGSAHPPSSSSLTQKILWLRHKRSKHNRRYSNIQRLSPQPHASHQSPECIPCHSPSPPKRPNSCSPRFSTTRSGHSSKNFLNFNRKSDTRDANSEGTSSSSPTSDVTDASPSAEAQDIPGEDTEDPLLPSTSVQHRNLAHLAADEVDDDDEGEDDVASPNSTRRLFGGSRPIASLTRPLVALAVPGMFLVCKYHQYRRAHQEASRRRAAERELHHLNHKIVRNKLGSEI